MAEIVDMARGALNAQPFSALLGTKLMQVDSSSLTLSLTIRDELRQQHGFVHGGVVSYLVDNALTFAGALRLGPKVVTGEYKINYLRPAVSGTLMNLANRCGRSGVPAPLAFTVPGMRMIRRAS